MVADAFYRMVRVARSRLTPTLVGIASVLCFGVVAAQAQCANPANAIVAENCQTGSPASEWDVGAGNTGDLTIQGFSTDISVNQGGTIFFKISTPASAYTINIYRMGYYLGGTGARKVATIVPSAHLPQTQPACMKDATVGLADCGNWGISASWAVPATAVSGIYFAHLVRTDTGGDSHIVFIVRNDASHSAIMYQTADETWQAYNYYGSGSLYSTATPVFDLSGRSYKVSYNRPVLTRGFDQEWDTWVFGAEFAMVQWLEANGYDVTYTTGIDAGRSGALIKNHKIYMDSGHDEYWSGPQRANVQTARDAGVNLAFFSGNTMFWKTRFENSIDGSTTPNRTLVCYKETLAFAKIDPQDPPTWTGTWRDPSFSPPADGGSPENSLTGSLFVVNGTGTDNDGSLTMKVPSADGKMRFWRNTAAATLAANATYTLPVASLGYEWEVDADNGFRPAGAFQLSTATYQLTSDYLLDYGATYGAGSATHHVMMYRAASGALVFSTGSIDWSWGLNSNHDNLWPFATPAADHNVQQATVNLFADMGVQPATLQPGVVPATASSDATPPASSIASPVSGAVLNTGSSVTVSGTASDSGGVVGGVEVSTDGGTTWHPAVGRGSWTYAWTPSTVNSTVTLKSRAVDDSGNLEVPLSGTSVNVVPQVCPCSIWNASRAPASADSGDATAVEVGVKFRADADGSVLGVRFYKSAKNTGSHIGHVWSSSGTLLGTANFTGESASGWQQANFSAPIPVTANTTYVVSYYAPAGHYAADAYAFAQSGVDNPPLHALASGVDGQNGVFVYPSAGVLGGFPTRSNAAANYWADVVYTSSNTFSISGALTGAGGAGATLALSGTESISTTADGSGNYSFTGVVNGSYTVTPTNAGVTFTPSSRSVTINGGVATGINFTGVVTNPLSISGTITGGAGAGVKLGGAATASVTADSSGKFSFTGLLNGSYSVTPVQTGYVFTPGSQNVTLSGSSVANVNFQGQVCQCSSIWQPTATPALIDANDGSSIEVGVKFRADANGSITALRFYKAAANTGTHLAHLWTSTGVLLGTATFTGETASGWQQVNFASPIAITANTTYVASYYGPSGHYSADTNAFATAGVDAPPLHALVNGLDGPNGVYLYTASTSGAFPTSTYASTNYWVDVVYTGAQGYGISGSLSAAGAGASVALSGTAVMTTTADAAGNYAFSGVNAGVYSVTPGLAGVSFVPGNQNVTIASANVAGVNFAVPALCPCKTLWTASTLPGTPDSGDGQPYELGVKFRADADGYILGVRFYKAGTNTGTHAGHLWSPAAPGSPLATATFTGEGASGWQQVLFANPVPVTANTTYVASYFAPAGHYSNNPAYFATAGIDNAPLHALAEGVDGSNAVYAQSASSVYPASTYNSSNYWVDVIYGKTTTHSLGGIVTGAAVAGINVALSGAAVSSTTTDASGRYTFSGLSDGTYTATPSLAGYVFSPASVTAALSGAHSLAVNFTSAQPTFGVSGTVTGGAGLTVTLTGTSTLTTTTGSTGTYNFSAVPNGSYTATPSGAGYTFSPAKQAVSVNGASVAGVNFTATSAAASIMGTISGGGGASVLLTGAANVVTVADASGNYSFAGVATGTYTITPAGMGMVFSPTSQNVAVAGATVSGVNFAVPQSCPCATLWQPTATPAVIDVQDNSSIEVGVKFRSDASGYVTGVRFYKSAANTGTHTGHLWSATGAVLATATFTQEGASGWQQALFSTPVAIAANTTYVASYVAPAGHYSADSNAFASAGVDASPLHALANGVDGTNGVYVYGVGGGFPINSYNSANYWVDAIFVAAHAISGSLTGPGGAGATVTISGSLSATATSDGAGHFSFPAVPNGVYTVTPSAAGTVFAPQSQSVTVSGSDASVPAFTASAAQGLSITGTIGGPGGNGAVVALSGGATATTTASASGVYSFAGLGAGSYTVTPSKAGFVFTAPSQTVTLSGANGTANFASAAQGFTLSGTISGSGGAGATVQLTGAATATVTASASGAYSFAVVNGSYTVTPTKTGFVFTPASQTLTISGANGTANFSAAVPTFTLSGTITGAGGSGATVALSGASTATATANASGVYTFSGLVNGSYTVTPKKTGFAFTPGSRAVTLAGANGTASFTSVATFTISGTISGPGAAGATVSLTGSATATVTSNASGVYTFTGVPNGSYTVRPTKTGRFYVPSTRTTSVNSANVTGLNFSSL